MLKPRSYTREDVVELHCHGGSVCVQRVLSLCLVCARALCARCLCGSARCLLCRIRDVTATPSAPHHRRRTRHSELAHVLRSLASSRCALS